MVTRHATDPYTDSAPRRLPQRVVSHSDDLPKPFFSRSCGGEWCRVWWVGLERGTWQGYFAGTVVVHIVEWPESCNPVSQDSVSSFFFPTHNPNSSVVSTTITLVQMMKEGWNEMNRMNCVIMAQTIYLTHTSLLSPYFLSPHFFFELRFST